MREINNDYEPEEYGYYPQKSKRKLKHPGRFIVFIVTFLICIWMVFSFILSLGTGQKFSIFGISSQPVRNIVVAGIDKGGYRTDLILLCQINRYNNEVNILQIPRDTKVTNNRNDKKINSAYFSGFECMNDEIKQVTGLKASDYIMVDFEGFIDIINALGGVTVDVPIRMNYTDPVQNLVIDLKPGKQKLNGEKAQMFMRFRKNNDGTGYPDGDIGRLEAQKSLYSAVAKKILSPMGILRSPAVFAAVKANSETNLNGFELFGVLKDVVPCVGNINIHTIPGEGKYIGGGSYFVPYKNQTEQLISENFIK